MSKNLTRESPKPSSTPSPSQAGLEPAPLHECLDRRWSPRSFASRAVEPDKLLSLFEAARWAPSSFNAQPWAFIVGIRGRQAEFDRLKSCLIDFNQSWASRAPVLLIAFTRPRFHHNGQLNPHAWYDLGAAVMNLTFQATGLGLHVHQMAGFDHARVRATYSVPDDWEPATVIAIGYQGDADALPEPLRARERAPRQRKEHGEFVFHEAWGRPLDEHVFAEPAKNVGRVGPLT